jgi:hypothetical protein
VLANVSTLLLYAACCVAGVGAVAARRAAGGAAEAAPAPAAPGASRVPFHPAVPWLALGVIALLLTGAEPEEWAVVLGVLAAAAAGYALTGRGRRAAPAAA